MQTEKKNSAGRWVVAHMLQQDKSSSQQCFIRQKCSGENRRIASPVAFLCYSPAPDDETGHHEQGDDTGYSVREFDDGLPFGACPDDVAITERPPIAAARA
jgi:hypothetical protein